MKLTGKLHGWTSPKDVILKVAGILTVKGNHRFIFYSFLFVLTIRFMPLIPRWYWSDCRILWSRSWFNLLHWYGNHMQHGGRNWSYYIRFPIQSSYARLSCCYWTKGDCRCNWPVRPGFALCWWRCALWRDHRGDIFSLINKYLFLLFYLFNILCLAELVWTRASCQWAFHTRLGQSYLEIGWRSQKE